MSAQPVGGPVCEVLRFGVDPDDGEAVGVIAVVVEHRLAAPFAFEAVAVRSRLPVADLQLGESVATRRLAAEAWNVDGQE